MRRTPQQALDAGFNAFAFLVVAKDFARMGGTLSEPITIPFPTRGGAVYLTLSMTDPETHAAQPQQGEGMQPTRIEVGMDAVEVTPSRIGHGYVQLRVASPDGRITVSPEDVAKIMEAIATAQSATPPQENEGRRTLYVQTDGGIAGLAARHGIDLVVVPEPEKP